MTIRNHLAAMAIVAVLAALAIAYILIPPDRWTDATIASVVALALAVGSLIYLPGAFAPAAQSSSAHLAGVGPVGLTTLVWFAFCVAAVIASLANAATLAWALLVVALATLIVGLLLSNVVRKTVDRVQSVERTESRRYSAWTVSLNQVVTDISDSALKARCTRLAEELRYMPSARVTDAVDEASCVAAALSALQSSAAQGDAADVAQKLTRVQEAMALHASALTALRSQA
jgi:uncharacterized membrane protein